MKNFEDDKIKRFIDALTQSTKAADTVLPDYIMPQPVGEGEIAYTLAICMKEFFNAQISLSGKEIRLILDSGEVYRILITQQ